MEKAEGFGARLAFEEFVRDEQVLYAVEYCFVVVGEALRHVPDAVRAAHPEVPWRSIVGMRNRIAHDYLYTDHALIWETLHAEFPALRQLLREVLSGPALPE